MFVFWGGILFTAHVLAIDTPTGPALALGCPYTGVAVEAAASQLEFVEDLGSRHAGEPIYGRGEMYLSASTIRINKGEIVGICPTLLRYKKKIALFLAFSFKPVLFSSFPHAFLFLSSSVP